MLSWFCTHPPPNLNWCFPRTQVMSSRKGERIVVEVGNRIRAAADGELALGNLQAVLHHLVEIHAQRGRVDVVGGVSAIIHAPQNRAVKGIHQVGCECVGVAEHKRLHPLDKPGLRCDQDVVGEKVGRLLKAVDEVPAIDVVFGIDRPIDPGDKLVIVSGKRDGVFDKPASVCVYGRIDFGQVLL